MRILIGIPCLLNGGTEIQTLSLCKVLTSDGHSVFVVCYFENDKSITTKFKNSGCTVRTLNLERRSGFLKLIFRLRNEFISIQPDVVHIQYMAPGALPIIAARLAGIETIFATVHQPYTKSHGIAAKLIMRTAFLLTNCFTVVSLQAEKSWFGFSSIFDENLPLKSQKRHFTIFNSVETAQITAIVERANTDFIKETIGLPPGKVVIGAVSRLRYEKGIDLLIDAFTIVKKKGFDASLLLVGTGPEEVKLKQKVVTSGLSDNVVFFGEADWEKAIELLSIMDIVVVPSRFEGFGLTAAESMAVGKPVIASDNYGLNDIIIDSKTGLIFQTNNHLSLSEKLQYMIKNPDLFEKYGSAGLVRVRTIFDSQIYEKKIKSLYRIFCRKLKLA